MSSSVEGGRKLTVLSQVSNECGLAQSAREDIAGTNIAGVRERYRGKLLLKEGKLQGLIFTGNIRQAGIFLPKIGQFLEKGYWGTMPFFEPENIRV